MERMHLHPANIWPKFMSKLLQRWFEQLNYNLYKFNFVCHRPEKPYSLTGFPSKCALLFVAEAGLGLPVISHMNFLIEYSPAAANG